ncbi:DUF1389 domain-containing protein [Candidatus Chlamydia corallus]|uniref:DUF1389 domain-containing protein n=1 Tax=Candidatus Chlamydia corallus TaxID=2038470 RepID=UPI000C2F99DF|nr:DUF1389 domain-containing protein [Candidatus Chlamydia corallus]
MNCNSLTSIPHTFLKNNCESCISCSLKNRTIIQLILGIFLALTSALTFVFLSAPISYAVGGTLALAAITVLIVTLVMALAKPTKVAPISNQLLNIIYNRYPRKVFDFVKAQSLTVDELKIFISCWKSDSNLPPRLNKKAEAFGIEILEAIDLTPFPNFEDILLRYCPLHWLFHFISKTECVGQEPALSAEQKIYGLLGPLAFHRGYTTIFHPFTRPLLSLISEKDYAILSNQACKNKWNVPVVKKICEEIFRQFKSSKLNKEVPYSMTFQKDLAGISQFLFLFFSHSMTWEQALMIQLLDPENWKIFCQFDRSKGHCSMAAFGGFLITETNMLNPQSPNYEAGVDFLTWEEFNDLVEKGKKSPLYPATALIQNICSMTRQHQNLLKRWQLVRNKENKLRTSEMPQYNFNSKMFTLEKKK